MSEEAGIEYDEWGRLLGDSDLATGCYYNGFEAKLPLIAKVLYSMDDGSDETNYHWLVAMRDGAFAYVSGGHDYTGWDCQSGIDWHDAASLNEALLLAPQDVRRIFEEMIERKETHRTGGF